MLLVSVQKLMKSSRTLHRLVLSFATLKERRGLFVWTEQRSCPIAVIRSAYWYKGLYCGRFSIPS